MEPSEVVSLVTGAQLLHWRYGFITGLDQNSLISDCQTDQLDNFILLATAPALVRQLILLVFVETFVLV